MEETSVITSFGLRDDTREPYVAIELANDDSLVLSLEDAETLAFNLIVSAHRAMELEAIISKYGDDSNEQHMINVYYKTVGVALSDSSSTETSPEQV